MTATFIFLYMDCHYRCSLSDESRRDYFLTRYIRLPLRFGGTFPLEPNSYQNQEPLKSPILVESPLGELPSSIYHYTRRPTLNVV